MKLYNLKESRLNQIPSKSFKLEKDIQQLVEDNVDVLFDLEFVKSEMRIQNFRLDTLCYDSSSSSFVIIEYKKGSSYSVIDQGYTYLSLMLNNKADFILEYNELLDKNLKREEVDWSQSRILFISPKFSDYQKNSVNFKNVPFELWEISRFENHTVGLTKLETESDVDISSTIPNDSANSTVKQVSKEIIKLDENHHLFKSKNRPDWVVELYFEIKNRILALDDNIEIKYGKQTIGFKQYRVFTDLIIYNKGIGVVINLKQGELNDNLQMTEDLSKKGHWGSGDYRIWLKSEDNIDYAIKLIRQAFEKQKKIG